MAEKSRKIKIFRNGDVFNSGKKLVVSSRVYKNYEQFLYNVSEQLNLFNGAVRRVYTLEGSPIYSLEDLQDGAIYVATAGENFKKVAYNLRDEGAATILSNERLAGDTTRSMYLRRRKFIASRGKDKENTSKDKSHIIFGPGVII